MKCVIYTRVSSKEQEREGYSIPAQQKLLREYATKLKLVVAKEFSDVETAKTAGRTQFGKMVEFLRAEPSVRVILVEKTDRLYRNFRDYVTLEDLDLEIHLVKEGEVLSKDSRSHAKFIHGIKLLMAKNYIDNLSEEVKKGLREKAEQGQWPCKAPLGYLNNKETHRLEIDPERAPIIAELFRLYASGEYSITTLAEKARELRLHSRESATPLSRSYVEAFLKNPLYTGVFVWKGNRYAGSHIPLISRELFDDVQEQFRKANKSKKTTQEFAFKGLLQCGYCGCSITAEVKKGRYIYYRCTNGKGKCRQHYIRQEALATMLGELLKRIKLAPDIVEQIREALRSSFDTEKEFRQKELSRLRREHSKLQERLDQAYIDRLENKIDVSFWEKLHTKWTEQQNEISQKIQRLEKANRDYVQEGIDFLELTERAYSLYLEQSPDEQARLLKTVLSNCTIRDLTLYPTYRKPFDIIAEGGDSDIKLGCQDSNLGMAAPKAADLPLVDTPIQSMIRFYLG
jgi:site-specific DNA recombinase